MKKEKPVRLRGRGFGIIRGFLKIFIRKTKVVYLGEPIKGGSIILSNHVGKTAPLAIELYLNTPFRFWGTYEMNEGLVSVYKYLSDVFYPIKMHWNKTCAKLFCLIAAPLTNMFYKGLNLISTYPDGRFKKTVTESVDTINLDRSIVLFPEDSTVGYFDVLKGYYGGFVVLANACYKKGIDVPIHVAYFKKQDRLFIVDKPIMYSELVKQGLTRDQIAEKLCNRANELKDLKLD